MVCLVVKFQTFKCKTLGAWLTIEKAKIKMFLFFFFFLLFHHNLNFTYTNAHRLLWICSSRCVLLFPTVSCFLFLRLFPPVDWCWLPTRISSCQRPTTPHLQLLDRPSQKHPIIASNIPQKKQKYIKKTEIL